MITTQNSLFGYTDPSAPLRFRKTDPSTSSDVVAKEHVARRLNANGRIVLRVFATGGNDGFNAHQVAERCDLSRYEVSRRAAELDADGLVEKTGAKTPLETGHNGVVRRVTSDGLVALRGENA